VSELTGLNSADYSFWSVMQKKVYRTHIANIISWNVG